MVTCQSCNKAEAIVGKQQSLCDECFLKLFLRRLRKSIKEQGWIERNATVDIIDDGSIMTLTAYDALKDVLGALPCTLRLSPAPSKAAKIVWTWTSDDITADFWTAVFQGSNPQLPKGILIFSNVTTQEVQRYARIRGVVGEERKHTSVVAEELSKLEARYPGLTLALMNSTELLENPSLKS